jgi:tetratricopeptide (TPR) repeat protein
VPLKKGEDDNTIQLYMRAFHILNNSFSLINLMQAYYLKGEYDKVHEYSDKCISLALEEGNTCNLAECYIIIGDVYACMNIIDLMMPFYNRAIHLLQNTGWKERLETVYYNIGATLIADKKYELAMQYLDKVNWKYDFLLSHKIALILIRSGKREEAERYISLMKQWVNDHDTVEKPAAVEKLMLEEALFECREDFLADPQYISLMEKLMDRLHNDRHKGYVNFYQDVFKKAYCRQRKYKKALNLYD